MAAEATMFSGQLITGGVLSITATVKEQLGPAVIVQLTVVVPVVKNEPAAGVQATAPQEPATVGAG